MQRMRANAFVLSFFCSSYIHIYIIVESNVKYKMYIKDIKTIIIYLCILLLINVVLKQLYKVYCFTTSSEQAISDTDNEKLSEIFKLMWKKPLEDPRLSKESFLLWLTHD